jgi:AcrR family transcriptional regulator
MTEHEWLACRTPKAMLRALGKSPGGRKMQHFICGVGRLIWNHFPNEDFEQVLALQEQAIDVEANEQDVTKGFDFVRKQHRRRWERMDVPQEIEQVMMHVLEAATVYDPRNGVRAVLEWGELAVAAAAARGDKTATREEFQEQVCDLLRDLFPPRTREYRQLPAFAGGGVLFPSGETFHVPETARLIAAGIHADQAFDRLPILADALEDANCGDRPLLDHLRHPKAHRRGCWALDAVLGRG